MQVLLVEDDALLAEGIIKALAKAGFSASHVSRGGEALHVIRAEKPEIVILDLGLPDMDGLTLLKTLRAAGDAVQVLVLTARDAVHEKVSGLDAGADDYLIKPFETSELLARLRVIERRIGSAGSATISVGNITLDTSTRIVMDGVRQLNLSKREYMLLKALMERVGSIQTKEALETRLYSWGEEIASNAIEVHIHNLRRKLEPGFIQTVRGMGYMVKKR
jgi:DNA-binding response OmpR family regulator